MTTTSYLNPHLTQEWNDWLNTNISNGVEITTLAKTLEQHGYHIAVGDLLKNYQIDIKHPQIDLSKNFIDIDNRRIPIIFTAQAPKVVVFDNFLSHEECQQLIACAEDKFQTATVVNAQTGEYFTTTERTSMNAVFQRQENAIISVLENRIAQVLNFPIDNGEGLQILRYHSGGEYKPHFDFFDTTKAGGQRAIEIGGQRVATFLTYLSDVESGGATRFPSANCEIRPKEGMALYFSNILLNNNPDPLSLHSSVPVITGTKYIATKWLRQYPYG